MLHAYVAPGQVLRLEPFSSVTFGHIFQNRPDQHRYAVTGRWDLPSRGWAFDVFDLYAAKLPHGKEWTAENIIAPKPKLTHTDIDAAIMASVLLYGSNEK